MNTIPVEEVNTYLLSEAIVNIRATLERLPEGAHRNQLITLIELIEPELSDKDLSTATLARHLSSTIEMQGFGIGGIPKSPESLWPDMKWSLDDRYFYAYSNMIIGIQAVFRSLEAFIDPGSDITKRYKGKLEMGHKPRFHLSACRRPETDRRPSENWIYIENSENSWYSKEELENFMDRAFAKGYRGYWMATVITYGTSNIIYRPRCLSDERSWSIHSLSEVVRIF